ncbi:MAG: hypothetical protein QGI09_08235, partial [Dehalococcoidia bacterium]|nr:hypothetical protein [Dehalococcoidia bacterium]
VTTRRQHQSRVTRCRVKCVTYVPEQLLPISPVCTGGEEVLSSPPRSRGRVREGGLRMVAALPSLLDDIDVLAF